MNEKPRLVELKSTSAVTVGSLLQEKADSQGDSTALVYHQRNKSYTYRDFNCISRQVAKGLLALGTARGEHVAVLAPNLPEWLFVLFGCAKAGAPLVTVNTNYRTFELEYTLKQSDAAMLFLADGAGQQGEYLEAIYEICPELKTAQPGELKAVRLPELRNVIFLGEEKQPGMFSWEEFLTKGEDVNDGELDTREQALKPDDVFTIQYTSGTTGVPKGAMLTHGAYINNSAAIAQRQRLSPQDTVCIPLPFFHAYGYLTIISAITAGSVIAAVERFRAQDMLLVMENCRATAVSGTPTMFVAALEEMSVRPYDLSALRSGNMAGAPCPPELVKAVVEKMGVGEFGVLYGSTECLITIMNTPDAAIEHRTGTMGRAMPGIELKIVDPRTGQETPAGIQGELCIKGPTMMKGYYKMPEATAKTIDAGGWFHSGDLVSAGEDGFYRITGRIKDMIIRGGENIYPAEIEEFLFTHPKVKDSQVVGIPCPYYGEDTVAFVRLKPGQTATPIELKRYCRERIALNKVPAHFFFIEQYPQTASGKVQKFKLREMAIQMVAEREMV